MHSPKMLMHRRTMILHGCSTELQIATIFSQVFAQRETFSLKYGSLFLDYLLILRGVFPMMFSQFSLVYQETFYFIYIVWVNFGLVSKAQVVQI